MGICFSFFFFSSLFCVCSGYSGSVRIGAIITRLFYYAAGCAVIEINVLVRRESREETRAIALGESHRN